MDVINNRWNKSTIFILPLLYPDIKYTSVIFQNFINCYISDITSEELDYSLTIEYDDNIAKFNIPEDKIDDYLLIKKSRYSKISDTSKQDILYFWEESKDSYLYSILYKTQKILDYWAKESNLTMHPSKDKEYWPKFNLYEESRISNYSPGLYKMFNLTNNKN